MFAPRSRLTRFARPMVAVAAVAVAACAGDSATGARRPGAMTLSFTNRSAAAASPFAALASAAPITVTGAGNTLVVDKVQVVLGEIELEQAAAECVSGSDDRGSGRNSRSSECPELELDPVLVDVPLDGVATMDLGALVPAGTYRELEFKIEKADDDTGAEAAFVRAHPDFRGVTVRVEGTFNGQPFTFRSALEARIELEFHTPLVVTGDSPLNLTVSVDVASWFKGDAGAVLDPSSSANALRIAQNVRASFGAFEDHDRDGEDDHGGRR